MLNVIVEAPTESFGSNMYILESEGSYAVIDPSVDFSAVARRYPRIDCGAVKYIILTHAHFDHFLAIDSWRDATGAEVLIGRADLPSLSDPYKNAYKIFLNESKGYFGAARPLDGDDELKLGDETFRILDCPGHTPGGISVLFDGCVFVGDTVFADGAYGRCDLPGGSFGELKKSIRRLTELPDGLKVYPGHGRATDINEIRTQFSIF